MKKMFRIAAIIAAAAHSAAMADLLVSEDFSDPAYVSGSLNGQSARGVGLNGQWAVEIAGNLPFIQVPAHFVNYVAENIPFGSLINSGGAVDVQAEGIFGGRGSILFQASIALPSAHLGTLYTAYLFEFREAAGGVTSSQQVDNRYLTYPSFGLSLPAVAYAQIAGASTGQGGAPERGLVLGRFTNVGMPLSASNPGTATLWMLSVEQFEYFKEAGLTDNELDLATTGENPNQISGRATQTITSANDNTFQSGDMFLSKLTIDDDGRDAYVIDAIRYGSSLNDVTPIPEPSVGGFLLGALWFTQAVRRRSLLIHHVTHRVRAAVDPLFAPLFAVGLEEMHGKGIQQFIG